MDTQTTKAVAWASEAGVWWHVRFMYDADNPGQICGVMIAAATDNKRNLTPGIIQRLPVNKLWQRARGATV